MSEDFTAVTAAKGGSTETRGVNTTNLLINLCVTRKYNLHLQMIDILDKTNRKNEN